MDQATGAASVPRVTVTRTCKRCGTVFSYDRHPRQHPRDYCSQVCRSGRRIDVLRASREPLLCRRCGTEIDLGSTGGRARTAYCSDACKEAQRADRLRAERVAERAGRVCRHCGGPMPLGLSARALTCSIACGVNYSNRLRSEKARQARMTRPRPPCSVCGSDIDPTRRRNVVYCSEACKRVALGRRYRARHPDLQLARLGLEPGDYERLLVAQEGRCAICGATEPGGRGGRFHVDHDHATGRVRGLLCHGCNVGIGMLHDDPAVMRAAISYVERQA
jgi:predicted nucleic acid-binding Zn ribbon protein